MPDRNVDTPDFARYQLVDLLEARASIDPDRYPERRDEIERQIALREKEMEGGGFVLAGEINQRKPNRWYATVERLSAGTVFRVIFAGTMIIGTFAWTVIGLLGAVSVDVLPNEGEYVHGWKALVFALGGIVVGTPIAASVLFVVIYLGLRVYALLAPLKIEVIVNEEAARRLEKSVDLTDPNEQSAR